MITLKFCILLIAGGVLVMEKHPILGALVIVVAFLG